MCYCGDTRCRSCGPAQGNNRCEGCGRWDDEGGCVTLDSCAEETKRIEAEISRIYNDAD